MPWMDNKAIHQRELCGPTARIFAKCPGLGPRLIAALTLAYFAGIMAFAQQATIPVPPPPPERPNLPPIPSAPRDRVSVQPAFSVVIDAAHGGPNTGARISTQLPGSKLPPTSVLEKDLTLSLSMRLRSALLSRGIAVVTTRDLDTDLPNNQRAGIANHALASACLVLHATATGTGVHLFTSSLSPAETQPVEMLPWETAQAAWITRSLRLSSEINSALGHARIPVTLGSTALQPLDNLTCPAVAIETAPLAASPAGKALAISESAYQQKLLDALAAAMLEWSMDWKQQP
jgi:N-acetylmuramoyl-L-alanine amidase